MKKARQSIATTVNAGLTLLYWHIGNRIHTEILKEGRAEYGKEIVVTLSRQLVLDYGKVFNDKNLRRMIQFAEVFPDEQIIVSLIRQLSWSHFVVLLPIKEEIKRDFYAEMCRIEGWNVRTLRNKIDSMLYERTALSRKPELVAQAELDALRKDDRLTPDLVFRDPYVLEFLNLNDRYLEKDLEDAIMRELEQFLLELGKGFCFLARQKRMTIDDEDFHLDLLFFHRDLKRLVAIELKLGDFKPEYKGQVELYLRWLDKHERRPGEEPPLGLILCAGKKKERIELLELDRSGIHVAEYLTILPPKELLQEKLHKAIELARQRLEHQSETL
ncbi:PDDEXK nuclease domain-containing protein [Candidatus Protochlamydia phocaeensis]|uniref:PDDEXK nuclease domain-containing protein n=1 Tax=Candidatus Protochlamydia phocaeensis TaxID=1414722 RepID=UPI001E6460A2|nr:PDDEXK nuclease domain-containing protein [Candidatus Protochlamydia phocaeensis]